MKKHTINIKKYRRKILISQNQLAKRIGISQSYLSSIEREEKSPTLRMLYRISEELSVCPRLLISCKIYCKNCNNNHKCVCDGGKSNDNCSNI